MPGAGTITVMTAKTDTRSTSWVGGFFTAWALATSVGTALLAVSLAVFELFRDGPASALGALSGSLIMVPFVAVVAAGPVAFGYAVLRFAAKRGAGLLRATRVKFGILFAFTLDVVLAMMGLPLHTPSGDANGILLFVAIAQIVSIVTAILIPHRSLGLE